MSKHKIVFTGGGTGGHVTPNIAIIDQLDRAQWEIHYIGSKSGIERELIEKINIPYHPIASGKLRRYIDFENIKDAFRTVGGIFGARSTLKKIKPTLVFSKGGFVSVPVILAAKSLGIPSYIHESDLTPGLANKISQRFATKIFTSFAETVKYLPANKTKAIGSPLRKDILNGSKENGLALLAFTPEKPVFTVMGGSLGARKINEVVRETLPTLTNSFQIVHICGKGNLDNSLTNKDGYQQFEYVDESLADILAATDFVVTRGGSNAIFEFLALKIPMLIIPLPKAQSRGDQILNAQNFTTKGLALTLDEESITEKSFLESLTELVQQSVEMKSRMALAQGRDALRTILQEIEATAK